ncbi:HNH endonuclease [Rummeliibacillus sp. SL167]|uniref:HNH endonuclease n=1 Tax=Rummeliibacillus sp. SL167 TaxID=2579792 RepID=UPI0011B58138|nr:HNH endonuclease signature motif containing protein [Rummeliibacillus sp. SL167]
MYKKKANPFYLSKAWKVKRQEILERDHYECQWCAKEGRVTTDKEAILEVDHIKELDDYPELALEDDNLRTLCKDCHNKRHNRFGFKKKANKWAYDERW